LRRNLELIDDLHLCVDRVCKLIELTMAYGNNVVRKNVSSNLHCRRLAAQLAATDELRQNNRERFRSSQKPKKKKKKKKKTIETNLGSAVSGTSHALDQRSRYLPSSTHRHS
jgi:hypothetical protein